jgi:hypothetical protein|eukprot:scaffold322_cov124-Chaetoceros_neogracile.AAC.1
MNEWLHDELGVVGSMALFELVDTIHQNIDFILATLASDICPDTDDFTTIAPDAFEPFDAITVDAVITVDAIATIAT